VGDNYFADVIGAQKAKMRAILIDPEGLFPEAECTVIDAFDELQMVLEK
jgi:FMN phosphatase YigB (HAD superfamily)